MRVMKRLMIYVAAFLVFIFCAGPVILSGLGSIIPEQAIFTFPPEWLSHGITFDNYLYIINGEIPKSYQAVGSNAALLSDAARQVPGSMLNSSIVAFWVMVINVVFGSPAAYAFARMSFRQKNLTFIGILMCRLVPVVALATPFYLLIQSIGILGTKMALILVHSVQTLPFTMLILTLFFRRIPVEIEDAAAVDGCNRLQSFLKITLPISIPSIITTGMFAFMLSYAEFLFALVLSGRAENRPLSVVMTVLARNVNVSWGLLNSAVFLALIPSAILVVFVWRVVVEGILAGAVKK